MHNLSLGELTLYTSVYLQYSFKHWQWGNNNLSMVYKSISPTHCMRLMSQEVLSKMGLCRHCSFTVKFKGLLTRHISCLKDRLFMCCNNVADIGEIISIIYLQTTAFQLHRYLTAAHTLSYRVKQRISPVLNSIFSVRFLWYNWKCFRTFTRRPMKLKGLCHCRTISGRNKRMHKKPINAPDLCWPEF